MFILHLDFLVYPVPCSFFVSNLVTAVNFFYHHIHNRVIFASNYELLDDRDGKILWNFLYLPSNITRFRIIVSRKKGTLHWFFRIVMQHSNFRSISNTFLTHSDFFPSRGNTSNSLTRMDLILVMYSHLPLSPKRKVCTPCSLCPASPNTWFRNLAQQIIWRKHETHGGMKRKARESGYHRRTINEDI